MSGGGGISSTWLWLIAGVSLVSSPQATMNGPATMKERQLHAALQGQKCMSRRAGGSTVAFSVISGCRRCNNGLTSHARTVLEPLQFGGRGLPVVVTAPALYAPSSIDTAGVPVPGTYREKGAPG